MNGPSLKSMRNRIGLSAKQFSQLFGYSEQYIYELERSVKAVPFELIWNDREIIIRKTSQTHLPGCDFIIDRKHH